VNVTAIVYREGCGTYLALLAHQANGEPPCSECLHAEDVRRFAHESIPLRLPPPVSFRPVTAEEAALNRGVLDREVREYWQQVRKTRAA
jgi:hypothetical protein